MAGRTCPCRLAVPLDDHDRDRAQFALVERLVAALGEYVTVVVAGQRYRVSRYCIALHGLDAARLDRHGFAPADGADPAEVG